MSKKFKYWYNLLHQFISIGCGSLCNALVSSAHLVPLWSLHISLLGQRPATFGSNSPDVFRLLHSDHVLGAIRSNLSGFEVGLQLLQRGKVPRLFGIHHYLSHHFLHSKVFRGKIDFLKTLDEDFATNATKLAKKILIKTCVEHRFI